MRRRIESVVVLGAGTMGSRIAAHMANAGVACSLLDISPKSPTTAELAKGLALDNPVVRNRIVRAGLESAVRAQWNNCALSWASSWSPTYGRR